MRSYDFVMQNVIFTMIEGAIASLIASGLFWLLSFQISGAEIVFPEKLVWQDMGNGVNSIRIKFYNRKRRDFQDVTLLGHLSIEDFGSDRHKHSAAIMVGINDKIICVKGDRSRRKDHKAHAYYQTLYLGEEAFMEYQKSIYKRKIRRKAKKKTLTIQDIFNEYQDEQINITVYITGYDAYTQRNLLFESPRYYIEDIIEGKYQPHTEVTKDFYANVLKVIRT